MSTQKTISYTKKYVFSDLARQFSSLEHRPVHWKAVGLISGQSTYLGGRFDPPVYRKQLVSLSLSPPPILPSPFLSKISKYTLT